MDMKLDRDPSIVDLFSGIGGFSLGAARAGFRVVIAVDVDPIANEFHAKNFPGTIHLQDDVRTLSGCRILGRIGAKPGEIDGVIGGPPCQGFSSMGHRRSDDARNELFTEFFRLVHEMHPKFFVAENVPGILDESYDSIRLKAMSLVEQGYIVSDPITLRASDYGAATSRTRVFLLGFDRQFTKPADFEQVINTIQSKKTTSLSVEKALEGLPVFVDPEWQSETQSWQRTYPIANKDRERLYRTEIPQGIGDRTACMRLKNGNLVSGFLGIRHSDEVIARFSRLKPGDIDKVSKAKRLERDGVCPTLRAGTDSAHGSFQAIRPIHYSENRMITTREAARLQGFPDWFVFHPTKWHSFRQIGNSVCPIVAETLLREMLTIVKQY